ncbi:MAG: thiamine phosphate synthase [Firmicutes bacterium HGW-Firmicutes-14]|nr:MAG: thiamine phosphate synthase [Firmicutes bacterium HGW-Firmicutes-14]
MPDIYIITNRLQAGPEKLLPVLEEAVRAGVDAIILREKDLQPEELFRLAAETKKICSGTVTRLIINSGIDAALAVGADGVHLGYGSVPLDVARKMMPGKIIGVSVHSPGEAVSAQSGGAGYLLAGHVFETASKNGQPGRGIGFIKELCSLVSVPVIAIGGINPDNAGQVISAGASGVAVMSLIMKANDIRETVGKLRRSLS